MLSRIDQVHHELSATGHRSAMFKAIPYGEVMVRQQIGNAAANAASCLSALAAETTLPPFDERPFVQLSYDEIDGQALDRILGSDICAANCAVGLPGSG